MCTINCMTFRAPPCIYAPGTNPQMCEPAKYEPMKCEEWLYWINQEPLHEGELRCEIMGPCNHDIGAL